MDRIAATERLWTVQIGNGVNEAYPGESSQVARICGDPASVTGANADAWHACRGKNLQRARYRIATLHAAPTGRSPVVASLFEERRVPSLAHSSSPGLSSAHPILAWRWHGQMQSSPLITAFMWPACNAAATGYGF